jgi:putative transposase
MKHISDSLWSELEKLLPCKKSKIGRPEFDNRKTFQGILYLLYTGAQWHMLPEQYGCPTTVHGKFMRWCRLGIFQKMMIKAREFYRRRNSKNKWYVFDTISKKAPFAKFGGKNPTDRAKRGIKYGILADRKGAPMFLTVASANTHDSKLFEPVLNQLNKSKNIRIIAADSAFDVKKFYTKCTQKNIALVANVNPRRKQNVHKMHAPYRWIIEQTFGILSWIRGLKVCWSKSFESTLALLQMACSFRLFKMAGIFG